jgi:hypothetical protein
MISIHSPYKAILWDAVSQRLVGPRQENWFWGHGTSSLKACREYSSSTLASSWGTWLCTINSTGASDEQDFGFLVVFQIGHICSFQIRVGFAAYSCTIISWCGQNATTDFIGNVSVNRKNGRSVPNVPDLEGSKHRVWLWASFEKFIFYPIQNFDKAWIIKHHPKNRHA